TCVVTSMHAWPQIVARNLWSPAKPRNNTHQRERWVVKQPPKPKPQKQLLLLSNGIHSCFRRFNVKLSIALRRILRKLRGALNIADLQNRYENQKLKFVRNLRL